MGKTIHRMIMYSDDIYATNSRAEWERAMEEHMHPIEAYYCNATPIGEKWPVCYLPKGHLERDNDKTGHHESADLWWDNDHPVTMKGIIG
jgi:hypothetical protein